MVVALNQSALGYELWLGCTKVPEVAAPRPESWENARAGITGTNLNLTGFNKRNRNNPVAKGEENLKKGQWRKIFAAMPEAARKGMMPIARSAVTNQYAPDKPSIEEKLLLVFDPKNDGYGYEIGSLLPYASRLHEDKKYDPVSYSTQELARIRTWLDTHEQGKFKDVKIVTNLRLFRKKQFMKELATRGKYIDSYLFEAEPDKYYNNAGNRQDMLKAFTTDRQLKTKDIIFQIPISPWDYENEKGATNFQMVRNFVVWLGDKYGHEFLRSDRVKFLITTYDPTIPFYPELSADKEAYQNTITGIVLSLIEQEALFTGLEKTSDGKPRKPTRADAYSSARGASSGNSIATAGSDPARKAGERIASESRTWKDASGRYEIEAVLVRKNRRQVTLRKSDGSVQTILIEKLSKEDQQFLKRED